MLLCRPAYLSMAARSLSLDSSLLSGPLHPFVGTLCSLADLVVASPSQVSSLVGRTCFCLKVHTFWTFLSADLVVSSPSPGRICLE